MTTTHWTPYQDGTSGHQGAASADAEPVRRRVIDLAYDEVLSTGTHGLTWRELASRWGCHHGIASAALSNLHRSGSIARLGQRRERCGVYVTTSNVQGRAVEPHRSNKRPHTPSKTEIRDLVADWLNGPGDVDNLTDRLMALIAGPTAPKE